MSCEKKNQTTESFGILLRILGCWEGSQKEHEATYGIDNRGIDRGKNQKIILIYEKISNAIQLPKHTWKIYEFRLKCFEQ